MDNEELKDIEILCKECGKTFIHSVRDQKFYKELGYENMPKTCIVCRKARKEARMNSDFNHKSNQSSN